MSLTSSWVAIKCLLLGQWLAVADRLTISV